MNATRVKEEIREDLIRYQRECYQVLADAFMRSGEMTSTPQTAAIIQVREMGRAIVRMADEMLALAERTTTVEVRLEKAATVVGHMNKRLTAVEQQVRAGTLTKEQAREIQHRVNLIAREMVKHAPAEKHYMGVYETLRQQTGVTSYKAIPPKGYEAAIAFLDQWLESLQEASQQE
jgi:methyl-accepting chemotaxis protein